MKRIALAALMGLALVGCGADGEPITPTANANVSVGTSGITTGVNLGLKKGKWNLNLGRAL